MIIRPIAFHPAMIRLKRIAAGMPDTDRRELISNIMRGEKNMIDTDTIIIALIVEHGKKLKHIANELNDRGITTTKGGTWTGNNLGMHIRSHDLYELAEKVKAMDAARESGEESVTNTVTDSYQHSIDDELVESRQAREEDSQEATNIIPNDVSSQSELPESKVEDVGSNIEEDYQQGIDEPKDHIGNEMPVLTSAEILIVKEMVANYQNKKMVKSVTTMPIRRPQFKSESKKNTGLILDKTIHELSEEKRRTEPERVGNSFSQLVEFLLWKYIGGPMNLVEGVSMDMFEQ